MDLLFFFIRRIHFRRVFDDSLSHSTHYCSVFQSARKFQIWIIPRKSPVDFMKNIFQNVKSDVVKSNQLKILKFLFEILARNDQEKKYSKCSFHL